MQITPILQAFLGNLTKNDETRIRGSIPLRVATPQNQAFREGS